MLKTVKPICFQFAAPQIRCSKTWIEVKTLHCVQPIILIDNNLTTKLFHIFEKTGEGNIH